MRRARGFTLIELMIVVAILGILATVAYGVSRAAFRNANLGSAAFELSARLSGLKAAAITTQDDHLFVLLDAPNASDCGWASSSSCARFFVLRDAAGFSLATFDPDSTGSVTVVESGPLPKGVQFHPSPPGSPPPPFSAVPMFHSELTATVGSKRRFAIRFVRDGSVTGEPTGSATGPWPGYAFALTTDQLGKEAAADRKGIVVSFPAGIVRTFSVQ